MPDPEVKKSFVYVTKIYEVYGQNMDMEYPHGRGNGWYVLATSTDDKGQEEEQEFEAYGLELLLTK